MVQVIKGLVVTLMVVAVGVVFFAIAYAGLHWYETGSFALIQDLDQDPFATLRRAYADVAVLGHYQQALYTAGTIQFNHGQHYEVGRFSKLNG